MTNEQKEYLIAKALETEEGRVALSNAMSNGIKFSQGYEVNPENKAFSVKLDDEKC